MTYEEVLKKLQSVSYPQGKERARVICATKCKMISVKSNDFLPIVKLLAPQKEEVIFDFPDNDYYEIDILKAYMVTRLKCSIDDRIRYLKRLAPHIENWAVCDSLGKRFKLKETDEDKMWQLAEELIAEKKCFQQRLGLDIIMSELLLEKYLGRIFAVLNNLQYGEYYMDMCAAWLLAEAYAKYNEQTVEFFANPNNLSKFVHNKALQKARESFRVTSEQKEMANRLKRK